MDQFRPKRNEFKDVSFESHIYFDDAFQDGEDGEHGEVGEDGTIVKKRFVNEYAETLVEVIREVYM